ncbi:MAG: hypothetical protein ACR2P4_04195 [Gammaproteobacteria bacterium]
MNRTPFQGFNTVISAPSSFPPPRHSCPPRHSGVSRNLRLPFGRFRLTPE